MIRIKTQKILVIRIDFLGDMVCTTPLLRSLRERWPQSEIHVLANKYNAAVLEGNSDILQVHHYVYSKCFHKNIRAGFLNYLIDRVKLILKLRKLRFDMIIIPSGGMNKNAIKFAKQLKVSDCRWHNVHTEFDDRQKNHIDSRPMMHEVLSGYKLLPELAMPDIEQLRLMVYPRRELILNWHSFFQDNTKPKVGLFVSNNCADRRWSWDKWQLLAEKLVEWYEVVIFHAPDEQFPAGWKERSGIRRVSTQTVPDLIAAMTYLNLVISADSAPVHLSSALNIPVVALFESRPEKYRRWHPIGVKNMVLHEGKQVNDISVHSVFSTVKTLLSEEVLSMAECKTLSLEH
jgi:ADP-heptose:LPS heptosyltransferase